MQATFKDRKQLIKSLSEVQLKKIAKEVEHTVKGKLKDTKETNLVFQEFIDIVLVLSKDKFFKNKNINSVANFVLDLVEKKKIYFSTSEHLPTITTIICNSSKSKESSNLVIMAPKEWSKMLREDPNYQMGTVVYICSFCKDFANGINIEDDNCKNRAMSFEAEFLNYLKENKKQLNLNDYQLDICNKFPNGCSSCDSNY